MLGIEMAWRQGGQRHVLQGSCSGWCQLVEGVAGEAREGEGLEGEQEVREKVHLHSQLCSWAQSL